MKKLLSITLVALFVLAVYAGATAANDVTQGTLRVIDKEGKTVGKCPLKHTDVKADISGFIARVNVEQQFHNPYDETIEAVYIFPLPRDSAVDSMVMKIGDRTIKGVIKEREEARKIYEQAKKQGKTAALLDQERPNIFTQSVANIPPGEEVNVKISYVQTLAYTDGVYEFVFPMVVGPRYIPGQPTGKSGDGTAPDTDRVPDASRITPPITPEGTRSGHDISVQVNLDAGVPIEKIRSVLHKIKVATSSGSSKAVIKLHPEDKIPNKDFILQYQTAGDKIEDAILTHGKNGSGFFTLILQPPKRPEASMVAPREMFFVIDSSGSQMGWPIEKAKETIKYCVKNMKKGDTFQLLSFSNNVHPCFEKPVPNTKENREKALRWLASQTGRGGTELKKAIDYSLGAKPDPQRMRIVVFMTDGYVGNDMEILETIKENLGNARIFPFGVGNSVNRYLLEGMARMGKGEVEWVTLNRHGDEVAEAFQEKIGNPLLLDIEIDWNGAPVEDVYPREIPDLFSGKPVIIKGRYNQAFKGEITLKGKRANKPFSRTIKLNLPKNNPQNDVLGVLWARTKISDLMDQNLKGIQRGTPDKEIKQKITELGLKFNLMTQFTSFVAVQEKVVTQGGKTKTVVVPVEMPEGVSYEGVMGNEMDEEAAPAGGGFGRLSPKLKVAPQPVSPSERTSYYGGYRNSLQDNGKDEKLKPEDKIAESLQGLAQKVENEGENGNLKLEDFQVKNGRVNLILTVTYVSDLVISKLEEVGFKVRAFSKTRKIITGVAGVEKIEVLAKMNFVKKIEPMPGVGKSGQDIESAPQQADYIKFLLGMLSLFIPVLIWPGQG